MFACVCVCARAPMCVPLTHACNVRPAADAADVRSGVGPSGRGRRGDRRQLPEQERRSPTAKVLTHAAAKLQRLLGDTVGVRAAVTSGTTAASKAEGRPQSYSSERRPGSKAGAVQRRNVADACMYSSTLHTHPRGGNVPGSAQSARGLAAATSCRHWCSAQSLPETRLGDVSTNVAPSQLSSDPSIGRASEPSIALLRKQRASCGNGVGNDVARAAVKRTAQSAQQSMPDTEHVPLWRVAADLVFRTGVLVITAGVVLGVVAMYGQAHQRSMGL